MESHSKIKELIDLYESRKYITSIQQNEIVELIQDDGVVDEYESDQLSRLFSLIEKKAVKLISEEEAQQYILTKEEEDKELRLRKEARQEHLDSLESIVVEAEKTGSISQEKHDRLMLLVHEDGRVDPDESRIMTRLHDLIASGKVTVLDVTVNQDAVKKAKRARKKAEELAYQEQIFAELEGEEPNPSIPEDFPAESEPSSEPPVSISAQALNPDANSRAGLGEASSESAYAFAEFVHTAQRRVRGNRVFELETDRILNARIEGDIWSKAGTMIGYEGVVRFTREGLFEHGVSKLVKRAATDEGAPLTKAAGNGTLYLADDSKKITIIDLKGDNIIVKGNNLLAFESSVSWDIIFLRSAASLLAGGMFNVRLGGSGMVALTTYNDPIVLIANPVNPLMTDPGATVAWSGSLNPSFKTDVNVKTLIGRTSGSTVQMSFTGEGFVVVQPYREPWGKASETEDPGPA